MFDVTGKRAEPADGGDDEDDQRTRRRDHGDNDQSVRAADFQQQDGLEGEPTQTASLVFFFSFFVIIVTYFVIRIFLFSLFSFFSWFYVIITLSLFF